MNIKIERLHQKVVRFRKANENADFSVETVGKEANLRMEDFPNSACSEACKILGIYLQNEIGISPLIEKVAQIEKNDKWYGTHHWLESEGYIIDITAGQFPMVNDPVLITRESEFHKIYAQQVSSLTNIFTLDNEASWIKAIYKSVKREILKN